MKRKCNLSDAPLCPLPHVVQTFADLEEADQCESGTTCMCTYGKPSPSKPELFRCIDDGCPATFEGEPISGAFPACAERCGGLLTYVYQAWPLDDGLSSLPPSCSKPPSPPPPPPPPSPSNDPHAHTAFIGTAALIILIVVVVLVILVFLFTYNTS